MPARQAFLWSHSCGPLEKIRLQRAVAFLDVVPSGSVALNPDAPDGREVEQHLRKIKRLRPNWCPVTFPETVPFPAPPIRPILKERTYFHFNMTWRWQLCFFSS